MDLILFGMQGSGKGTLGKFLAEKYNMEIFETGAELRKLSNQDSELAKKIKSIIEAGHLVPNEVVMEIVENFMNSRGENKSNGIIFDGIPRKVEQAQTLNALLEKHDHNYTGVLLNISQDLALKRLTTRRICQKCKNVYPSNYEKDKCEKTLESGKACEGELITRSDDNPEAIKTRLAAFANETIPAIELYKDKLIQLDGEPSIDEVKELAFQALDPILK